MNEQVKSLMIKHGLHKYISEDCQSRMTLLADLIVLECVNAVMDGTKEGDHYAQRIEQHFNQGTDGILHYKDES